MSQEVRKDMKEQYSPKQTAAMKARIRRMRVQQRRRLVVAIIIFFILGVLAGVFGYRWLNGNSADVTPQAAPAETVQATQAPEAEPEPTPEAWAMPESDGEDADIFPEDGEPAQSDTRAEQEAFPEVGADTEDEAVEAAFAEEEAAIANAETEAEPEAEPQGEAAQENEAEPEGEAQSDAGRGEPLGSAAAQPEATAVPDLPSNQVPEYNFDESEVPAEYLTLPDENGIIEAEEGQALTSYGPQVVAIVPYGESFTYTTEINADGNARVEASDAPYETVSFTQTMKSYMRPTDFANRYATQYKLQGDEAGAGFELILNDYTGEATIIPQNVIDISLRSESGDTVERGYQLMDAEIAGNYGIALTTNTPKMLYKRYQYSENGEEMAYLVVTTYKDGQTQMILFELESDEPEPEPEVVYTILQRGIKSDEVLAMQNRLIELGYLTGDVDGSFGPKTEEAIKAAQAAFGMEQTGIADNAFQQKLYEGAAVNASQATGFVTLTDGSTGDAVKRLQSRLKELGYYDGRIDGGFGPMMVAAVKKAQEAFGMEQTGIADSAFQERAFAGAQSDAAADNAQAAAAPADDGVTLSNGSTGDAVVKLQISLREQGFYSGKADGGYGPNTVAAVKAAQAAFGMEQTGVADAAFQARLYGGDAAAAETPVPEETPAPEGNAVG